MDIKIVKTETDISKTWEVMHLLRPHLVAGEYVNLVMEMLSKGYNMAYIEEDGKAVSAVGFRELLFLYNGRHIYIDDLSTLDSHRGKGYGGLLVDYVKNLAKEKGYKQVTLDSGYGRHAAHRLYMNKGFITSAHHFSVDVK
ncbi:MAG TPA: GNAT family N-acetyltransferase [Puia sp.]|nr:GNAT family N-acetyltransferase [Puia sp.]